MIFHQPPLITRGYSVAKSPCPAIAMLAMLDTSHDQHAVFLAGGSVDLGFQLSNYISKLFWNTFANICNTDSNSDSNTDRLLSNDSIP